MFVRGIRPLNGEGWKSYEVEVEVRDRRTLNLFRRYIEYVLQEPFHESGEHKFYTTRKVAETLDRLGMFVKYELQALLGEVEV